MERDRTSRIGQDFTLGSLLKFALPGLLTNLSSRLFETLDDALFISRFVGQTALAGIKILAPCKFKVTVESDENCTLENSGNDEKLK